MLPPGGSNNNVDPRFLSLFSIFCINFPSLENVDRIYNSILKSHLVTFDESFKDLSSKVTNMTLKLYNMIVQ